MKKEVKTHLPSHLPASPPVNKMGMQMRTLHSFPHCGYTDASSVCVDKSLALSGALCSLQRQKNRNRKTESQKEMHERTRARACPPCQPRRTAERNGMTLQSTKKGHDGAKWDRTLQRGATRQESAQAHLPQLVPSILASQDISCILIRVPPPPAHPHPPSAPIILPLVGTTRLILFLSTSLSTPTSHTPLADAEEHRHPRPSLPSSASLLRRSQTPSLRSSSYPHGGGWHRSKETNCNATHTLFFLLVVSFATAPRTTNHEGEKKRRNEEGTREIRVHSAAAAVAGLEIQGTASTGPDRRRVNEQLDRSADTKELQKGDRVSERGALISSPAPRTSSTLNFIPPVPVPINAVNPISSPSQRRTAHRRMRKQNMARISPSAHPESSRPSRNETKQKNGRTRIVTLRSSPSISIDIPVSVSVSPRKERKQEQGRRRAVGSQPYPSIEPRSPPLDGSMARATGMTDKRRGKNGREGSVGNGERAPNQNLPRHSGRFQRAVSPEIWAPNEKSSRKILDTHRPADSSVPDPVLNGSTSDGAVFPDSHPPCHSRPTVPMHGARCARHKYPHEQE
ncbi:hypothetical protein K438DRAFT_1955291 [Mycena galopus ATCC 62051]|nr:hypothetical protein K438DRAFT_1955291 [Mycena galopus ATCC 62051]